MVNEEQSWHLFILYASFTSFVLYEHDHIDTLICYFKKMQKKWFVFQYFEVKCFVNNINNILQCNNVLLLKMKPLFIDIVIRCLNSYQSIKSEFEELIITLRWCVYNSPHIFFICTIISMLTWHFVYNEKVAYKNVDSKQKSDAICIHKMMYSSTLKYN